MNSNTEVHAETVPTPGRRGVDRVRVVVPLIRPAGSVHPHSCREIGRDFLARSHYEFGEEAYVGPGPVGVVVTRGQHGVYGLLPFSFKRVVD